jgi:hypothetical protein
MAIPGCTRVLTAARESYVKAYGQKSKDQAQDTTEFLIFLPPAAGNLLLSPTIATPVISAHTSRSHSAIEVIQQLKSLQEDASSRFKYEIGCTACLLLLLLLLHRFVSYFMSRVQLLRSNGVDPFVVFDGGRLPIKGEEEQSRHR